MDFVFTSRPSSSTKPAWTSAREEPRPHSVANPPTPSFPTPRTPTGPSFGLNNNMPFLFREPIPQSSHSPPWAPPSTHAPHKATMPSLPPKLNAVYMPETNPGGPIPEREQIEDTSERALAFGALRRVYKERNERGRSQLGRRRRRLDDDEGEEEEHRPRPLSQKTTNHYTLNVAGPASQYDTPSSLLGYVQVVFNGSLAAMALYLLTQFILMIHTDVEDRICEHSMEIMQDIAQCQLAYHTNLCAGGRIPAMTAQCASWETCMNRDPTKVGRARITFEVCGEVINTFVEQISWKTLAFTVVSLAFFACFINSVRSFCLKENPMHAIPSALPRPIPPAIPYHAPHK
ncbi:Di-sulfide bridge nucleocytoplasmic transport domain-containing protein [Earliella scabrosa]|nr:Di-sulfide bridge nucleocytoplasmic transport domain-containing protein [Earliella scabrosa]